MVQWYVFEKAVSELVVTATRALMQTDWARVPQRTGGRRSRMGRQNSCQRDSVVKGSLNIFKLCGEIW